MGTDKTAYKQQLRLRGWCGIAYNERRNSSISKSGY
jgi:hypothetical protein